MTLQLLLFQIYKLNLNYYNLRKNVIIKTIFIWYNIVIVIIIIKHAYGSRLIVSFISYFINKAFGDNLLFIYYV